MKHAYDVTFLLKSYYAVLFAAPVEMRPTHMYIGRDSLANTTKKGGNGGFHQSTFVTLRKASIVQTAHRILTDRTTAQAMTPAQKRSRTIQMSDRNIPAASPAASVALLHKVVHEIGFGCNIQRLPARKEELMVRGCAWAL